MTGAPGPGVADALIGQCLRGESPSWPGDAEAGLGREVVERCGFHGVSALVCHRLGPASGWPGETVDRLRDRAAGAAIWELHHQRVLTRLLGALAERGIEALLLKGSALAYTSYAEPAWRERSDTDLLIPPAARDAAHAVLAGLGLEPVSQVSGDLVSYQASYRTTDRLGLAHSIDLHWRVNNAEVLSRLFEHDELAARSVAVPALGPTARAVGRVDALLIACMHREVHRRSPYWFAGVGHFSPDRLIWLHDLHLIAGSLSRAERDAAGRLARKKGLSGICRDGLVRAAEVLGTRLPPDLLAALDPEGRAERPRAYLRAGPIRQECLNFLAIPGPSRKLRFLRELAFPPPGYMRARYGDARPAWLPWLYLRRAVTGAAGRLARRSP